MRYWTEQRCVLPSHRSMTSESQASRSSGCASPAKTSIAFGTFLPGSARSRTALTDQRLWFVAMSCTKKYRPFMHSESVWKIRSSKMSPAVRARPAPPVTSRRRCASL